MLGDVYPMDNIFKTLEKFTGHAVASLGQRRIIMQNRIVQRMAIQRFWSSCAPSHPKSLTLNWLRAFVGTAITPSHGMRQNLGDMPRSVQVLGLKVAIADARRSFPKKLLRLCNPKNPTASSSMASRFRTMWIVDVVGCSILTVHNVILSLRHESV